MKILTITIHNVPNFGSVLQTLATQMLFEQKGCFIETIDYCPPRLRFFYRLKTILKGRAPLVKKVATFLSMDVLNKRVFNSFLKRRVKKTRRVYTSNEIANTLAKADLYLVGSDQVWNSEHNQFVNPVYYFDGIDGEKASFASSFGRSSLPEDEREYVKKLLGCFKMLSVREDSGRLILKDIFPEKNIEQILDPTLLVPAEEWRKIATQSGKEENKYVLIYPMSGIDEKLFYVARKVAIEIGAVVKILSPGIKNYKQCDETLRFQSPERFLELIDNAKCVVTNSFHGTVFSINLETPFISVMPDKFSTRLQSVLDLLGLAERIWNEQFDCKKALSVDFTNSREILAREREKASIYINRLLKK